MGDYKFKITVGNQLAQLNWLITVYLAIGYIFYHYFGFSLKGPVPYIYLAYLSFDILPTLLVHIQYYRANKGAVLDINSEFRTISYVTRRESLSYHFDDI